MKTRNLVESFLKAVAGLRWVASQRNILIILVVGILAWLAALWLGFSPLKLGILTLAIFLVFIAEMFNTAIENLLDFVSKDYHPQIRRIKDVTAGAVLLAIINAVVIGAALFYPSGMAGERILVSVLGMVLMILFGTLVLLRKA